ncbi:unnamed protein product [Ambrosiozyma monospora]|uniref:Unnamed protein product n=1 Tax=Ambrosiozyma monospora TaxID=43982 RepID=A0A9W6Z130_AMBMO|nr:unnamed protein product [Ambrosiozyma monospora]
MTTKVKNSTRERTCYTSRLRPRTNAQQQRIVELSHGQPASQPELRTSAMCMPGLGWSLVVLYDVNEDQRSKIHSIKKPKGVTCLQIEKLNDLFKTHRRYIDGLTLHGSVQGWKAGNTKENY